MGDSTAGIAGIKMKSKSHHTWTDDEIEQYRAHWLLGHNSASSWSLRSKLHHEGRG